MSTRNEPWPNGSPCWVDCQVDDISVAREFYAALFGWEFYDSPPEAGGYLIAHKNSLPVAGVGPKPPGMSMPSVWSTYFATDNVDATAEKVKVAGGTLLMEPFDVMHVGRMTFAMDPTGAAYGLWQAKAHIGVCLYNEPGTLCWNELHTPNADVALKFYASVFGYEYDKIGSSDFSYWLFKLAGQSEGVGGIYLDQQIPEGVPPHWLVWFATDDCDGVTAKAVQLGSQVLMPVMDSPAGRMSVVRAAQGEVFGLIDVSRKVGEFPAG